LYESLKDAVTLFIVRSFWPVVTAWCFLFVLFSGCV
jgi:hypothetical protein